MFPWCEQARQLVGPGILEHSRLWRRLATAASTSSRFPSTGIPRRRCGGGNDGSSVPALRRPGCAQGYGRGLRAPHGDRLGRARGAHLQDDDQGFARPVGLAPRAPLHPPRKGGGRRPFGNRVGYPQRRRLCLGAGERGARQECARAPKTDVNDATWLADLLAHGLIRGSFVPDEQTQEMRNLLRTRKQLVRECSRHIQRLQKTLEDANIKLDSVISDIVGLSGRRMIEALIAGETEPERLAQLAHRRIKAPPEALCEALRGRVTRHHRFLLRLHLKQIDAVNVAIDDIDQEVDAQIEPFRTAIQLLITIPGVSELSACVILAEIGHDMTRFPTAAHLISWAGLCPKNDESAGKRRSTRMRKG